MTNLEYVSPEYQERLDELAERLMTDRFIKSLGAEATDATLLEVEG